MNPLPSCLIKLPVIFHPLTWAINPPLRSLDSKGEFNLCPLLQYLSASDMEVLKFPSFQQALTVGLSPVELRNETRHLALNTHRETNKSTGSYDTLGSYDQLTVTLY